MKKILYVYIFLIFVSSCDSSNKSYEQEVKELFTDELEYITYCSPLYPESAVIVSNKSSIKSIGVWLLSASPPKYVASYADTLYELIFHYKNNVKISIKMGGPNIGYVPIRFGEHYVHADTFPDIPEIESMKLGVPSGCL